MSLAEDPFVSEFVSSMPPDYGTSFDREAVRAHAEIVARRGSRAVHVETWRELSERIVGICVVADDSPGLLSRISAALVASEIDVVGAHAFCRTRADGSVEAIDLLWVRRLPTRTGLVRPVRGEQIAAIGEAIARAAAGTTPEDEVTGIVSHRAQSRHDLDGEAMPSGASARIRFEADRARGAMMLTIEAVDRPGLLLAVTQALFRAGVQIVGLHATTERGCAVDRFQLVESDGKPLRQDRLLAIQATILGAIDVGTLAPQRRSAG